MVIINCTGYFKTWVDFEEIKEFDLGDGFVLIIDTDSTKKVDKTFAVNGRVNNNFANEIEVRKRVLKFLSYLSVYIDAPSMDLSFNSFSVENPKEPNFGSSTIGLYTIGGKSSINKLLTKGQLDKFRIKISLKFQTHLSLGLKMKLRLFAGIVRKSSRSKDRSCTWGRWKICAARSHKTNLRVFQLKTVVEISKRY